MLIPLYPTISLASLIIILCLWVVVLRRDFRRSIGEI